MKIRQFADKSNRSTVRTLLSPVVIVGQWNLYIEPSSTNRLYLFRSHGLFYFTKWKHLVVPGLHEHYRLDCNANWTRCIQVSSKKQMWKPSINSLGLLQDADIFASMINHPVPSPKCLSTLSQTILNNYDFQFYNNLHFIYNFSAQTSLTSSIPKCFEHLFLLCRSACSSELGFIDSEAVISVDSINFLRDVLHFHLRKESFQCEPNSIVSSNYRRSPNPRLISSLYFRG